MATDTKSMAITMDAQTSHRHDDSGTAYNDFVTTLPASRARPIGRAGRLIFMDRRSFDTRREGPPLVTGQSYAEKR
jgi:hypothetical protein